MDKVIIGQLNIRSLFPKLEDLKNVFLSQPAAYSIFCITETWISPDITDSMLKVDNYKLYRADRRIGRGATIKLNETLESLGLVQLVSSPTRNTPTSSTLIDLILVTNNDDFVNSCSHAPIRTIKITKPYSPWMTDNIRFLIFLRNKAKSKWRRTKKIGQYNYYKMLRNYTTTACRNEKKAYYDDLAKKQGMKKVWSNLKYLNIGKQNNDIPETLKNPTDLNKYYVSCIPRSEAKESVIKNIPNRFNSSSEAFNFKPITEGDVKSHILNIKSNAQGVDGVCVKLILMCCPLIVPFLTHIINHCLLNGVFPDCWKVAVVLPIPKKSKPLEYKDLRPINIACCIQNFREGC
nr:unnamed protein product [Callosobruchus analis]